nr:MAG TPA: hypothetical protein [Caudoviricetes sp.]
MAIQPNFPKVKVTRNIFFFILCQNPLIYRDCAIIYPRIYC